MDLLAAFRDATPRFFAQEFLAIYCDMRVGTQLLTGLRASNRAWRAAIPAPKPLMLRDLIRYVARAGDLDACCVIRDRITSELFSIDDVLIGAAEGGHEYMCRFAHDLDTSAGCQYSIMAGAAAEIGNINLCKLAREWEMRDSSPYGLPSWVIYDGARGGHVHICELALSWDPTCASSMLSGAASGGHIHVMKRALEVRGRSGVPVNWKDLMRSAVGGGNIDMCWFIHKKSGRSVRCSVSTLSELMHEWFKDKVSDIIDNGIVQAIIHGDKDRMRTIHDFARKCKCECRWQYILHKNHSSLCDMFRLGCQMMIEDYGEDKVNWCSVIADAARIDDIETVEMAIAQYKRHPRKLRALW